MKRNAILMLISVGGSAVLLVTGLWLLAAVVSSQASLIAVLVLMAVLASAFAAALLAAVRRTEPVPVPAHVPTPDDEFRAALVHRLTEESLREGLLGSATRNQQRQGDSR